MYEIIKNFLNEGGKCLLIENDKPIGVILTMDEYEFLQSKSQISNLKSQTEEKSLFSEASLPPQTPPATHPIGEAMAKEMDFPDLSAEASAKAEASAEIVDIEAVDDVTLGDLGIDPDIQLPKDF